MRVLECPVLSRTGAPDKIRNLYLCLRRAGDTSICRTSQSQSPHRGGAGRHRGGLGQEILLESRSDTPIAVSFLAERTRFPAFGIEGGQPGAPGVLCIDGERVDPKRQYVLRYGDQVELSTPGGGGHGDPAKRSETNRVADRKAGYVACAPRRRDETV